MSDNGATSSGELTSSAAVYTRACRLASVIGLADGTNAAVLTIYDNPSAASGNILALVEIAALGGRYAQFTPNIPIVATRGLYASVSGTGASVVVHFIPA